jgi:hypothetical protein
LSRGGRATASSSPTSQGAAMLPNASRVQRSGDPGSSVQPATSSASCDSSTVLRRRLSSSFQRDSSGSGLGCRPVADGTRGSSQGSSCQSPRIQRCLRREKVR